jgi:hypothetical protein
MTRTSFSGAILLVEGDRDNRFWKARTNYDTCRVIISGGRPQALGALSQLAVMNVQGLLAIVDPDLSGIVGQPIEGLNIHAPDAHDLESMLIRSAALDRVLAEHGDPALVRSVEGIHGKPLRQLLIDRVVIFARIRWWLASTGSNVAFERFKPYSFVSSDTWTVDEVGLLRSVASYFKCSETDLNTQLAQCPNCDTWSLCHGKDMVAMLAYGLQSKLGASNPGHEKIAMILRQSFEDVDFQKTSLWQDIQTWEGLNAPYRILRR